ncbi:MAG TPA: sulfotransferase [Candidatus Acidoferrum sp.]|jgi:tetratricopeptide (TPR) repeat protein|nr:sulfotransferase [Candidatus Acidoferrum sp.]
MKSNTLANKLSEAGHLVASGQLIKAQKAYKKLLQQHPRHKDVLMNYGCISLVFGDPASAERAWQALQKRHPADARLLLKIGHNCANLRATEMAQKYYEVAAQADRKALDPRISLASLHEKGHHFQAAREVIQECFRIARKDDQVRYFSAFLYFREDKLDVAETELRDLIASNPRHEFVWYASRYILAEILDKTGRYDEAMRYLIEAKNYVRNLPFTIKLIEKRGKAKDDLLKSLKGIPKDFIARAAKKVSSRTRKETCPFAFLGGNPRSGTTLLEQILGSHPQVVAADEPSWAFIPSEAIRPTAPVSQLKAARKQYIKFIEHSVGIVPEGKLLLEKNPGMTTEIPNLLRLFPDMRLLIALRDPRDIILSIYFQNIALNHVRFFTLEEYAKAYEVLMGVWLIVREWTGFSWMETRYEDIVSDT